MLMAKVPNVACLIQQKLAHCLQRRSYSKYVQGQSPKPGIREYFYFIDHQGMVGAQVFQKRPHLEVSRYLASYSLMMPESKTLLRVSKVTFLKFFFERLRLNETGRHEEFPYISLCGRERNFVRCDDLPIVFTSITNKSGEELMVYNYCGDKLVVPFQPAKIFMGSSGRIYHPGPEKLHGVGLIKSQLAIELSKGFKFEGDVPTHFTYQNAVYLLDNSLKETLIKLGREEDLKS